MRAIGAPLRDPPGVRAMDSPKRRGRIRRIGPPVILVLLGLFAYTQLTVFVLQPIGAVPNGATVLLWRRAQTRFIDSADAICARSLGGVSLLCRMSVLAAIPGEGASGVLLRFPYSETLYLLSTGGIRYDR